VFTLREENNPSELHVDRCSEQRGGNEDKEGLDDVRSQRIRTRVLSSGEGAADVAYRLDYEQYMLAHGTAKPRFCNVWEGFRGRTSPTNNKRHHEPRPRSYHLCRMCSCRETEEDDEDYRCRHGRVVVVEFEGREGIVAFIGDVAER